jgi:thymidylate synthase (FAD)
MNIINAPSVYLVGKQELNSLDCAEFLEAHGVAHWNSDTDNASEHLVEIAGRLCYMSFAKPRPGGNKAYIDHILEVGHGSVLEHAVYSMIFTGVSRSLTHELVRHRAGMSYSQLSQRYVDESDCGFVEPPGLDAINSTDSSDVDAAMAYRNWLNSVEASTEAYKGILEHQGNQLESLTGSAKTAAVKKVREAARSVLPNCTETKIFVTGNARAWRHFLELRGSIHADAEIQRLAIAVLSVLQAESPNLFGDYTLTDQGIETKWRKV